MDMDDRQTTGEILAMEERWMDAWRRRDLATCDRILGDEFLLTSALGGELFDRVKWLELARGPFQCDWFRFDEVHVKRYGDVAVAHSLYTQQARARGRDWSGRFRMTDVWVWRDGRWQVVSRHSTQLAPVTPSPRSDPVAPSTHTDP
jgi:ketosteroid isomerase-like protein